METSNTKEMLLNMGIGNKLGEQNHVLLDVVHLFLETYFYTERLGVDVGLLFFPIFKQCICFCYIYWYIYV